MTSTPLNQDAIKSFVREKLGCQCPDSVFEQIDRQARSAIVGREEATHRLLVGNRLLIYFLELEDDKNLATLLPPLVRKAKTERDRQGYNRLRVVVAANQAGSLRAEAEGLFAAIEEVDPKVHLHVLEKDQLAGVF